MSYSSSSIDVDREEVMDRIHYCRVRLCDANKRYKESDLSTLRWMLQHNVRKLVKMPLPSLASVINNQIELCEQLHSLVTSELDDSLQRHCLRLRHKLVEVGSV